MSVLTFSDGTSPPANLGVSGAGISPRKREVPPPTSGRELGSSILRPFWTAGVSKVVGYAMADRMRTSLVCQAIDIAVPRCPVEDGVTIFHSDRGSQYTSQRFLLRASPLGGAYGGVLGQCVGGILQRHAQE